LDGGSVCKKRGLKTKKRGCGGGGGGR